VTSPRSSPHMPSYVTPPQLARAWRINVGKILDWIRGGELSAINLAARQGGRPRYRISAEAIRDFELRRTVVPPPQPVTRRRRTRRDDSVIQFF
jgi:hypothetical protein